MRDRREERRRQRLRHGIRPIEYVLLVVIIILLAALPDMLDQLTNTADMVARRGR